MSVWSLFDVSYKHLYPIGKEITLITDLPAAFSIKRGFIQDELHFLPLVGLWLTLISHDDFEDGSRCFKIRIAHKFTLHRHITENAALDLHASHVLTGGACTFALRFHFRLEACLIEAQSFFLCILFCELNRETVRVIQSENIFTWDDGAASCFLFFHHAGKDVQSFVQRFMEAIFLVLHHFLDELGLFLHFRIEVDHHFRYDRNELEHERTIDADLLREAHSPSEQTSQYITASFIGRKGPVPDGKCHGPDMIGNDFECFVVFFAHAVFTVRHTFCSRNDRHEEVGIEVRRHALDHARHTL